MNQKKIIFIWSAPPLDGVGNSVIVKRHLIRLSNNGWNVMIAAPETTFNNIDIDFRWNKIELPMRKWWWPPFRNSIYLLVLIRNKLLLHECKKKILKFNPDIVLSVIPCFGFYDYTFFSYIVSKSLKLPLVLLIHDQKEEFISDRTASVLERKKIKQLLDYSERVFPITDKLAENYQIKKSKSTVILPIPDTNINRYSTWKNDFIKKPNIVYAGYLYDSQLPYLEKIAETLNEFNGFLTVVSNMNTQLQKDFLKSKNNIIYKEPFKKNRDVLNFLIENALATLVIYPFDLDNQPWFKSSFPSKLLEFSRLGLPILVFADKGSAFGDWCLKENWEPLIDNVEHDAIYKYIQELMKAECWKYYSDISLNISKRLFDPDCIHNNFESKLNEVLENKNL
ncbi:MAG: hypothetical protein ACRENO_01965 [Thermodesulfobacteriota bacterium]